MKLLGVPAGQFALCFFITTALTAVFFLPALSGFGHVLLGKEDIQFFIWLFWHYGQSVAHGTDPLYAAEIGYPYGVSLTASTITPFQGVLYLLLPAAWGVFGSITFLQVLSFVLGGLFSFALAYRFTKSFMPSLIGSFIFNFSAFHFEKVLHHLNYSMAMPFVALFFLCYYDALAERPEERHHLWLALALLLVALNEMAVAIMIGFIVFIDILFRHARASKVSLLSVRNIVTLGAAAALSILLFELSVAAQLPLLFTYVIPGLVFVAACLFLVLGWGNLVRREIAGGFFISMAVCAVPLLGYGALLALHGSYVIQPDSAIVDALQYNVPIEYTLLPSQLQQVAHLGLFQDLPAASDTAGAYLGPVVILLLLASLLLPKASEDENHVRDLGIICLLFSFPVIAVGSTLLMGTPFLAGPLFPLLGVLRSQSRFIMLALIFISIAAALLCARLFTNRKNGTIMAAGLALLLLAASWPALGSFTFEPQVPQFYLNLANETHNVSIFLYPDMDYYTLLQESYYQTIYGDNISYGVLSRFPEGTNPLFALYTEDNVTTGEVVQVVRSLGYDYVVVQKLQCTSNPDCFYGTFTPIPELRLDYIKEGMEKAFGNETYEDNAIIVYDTKPLG
jgi:hypothetical protein